MCNNEPQGPILDCTVVTQIHTYKHHHSIPFRASQSIAPLTKTLTESFWHLLFVIYNQRCAAVDRPWLG